jgi:phosphoglycolate phosphatase-like HAD superfamily hydrolase
LKQAFAWSLAVNKAIAEMVRGVPPFPFVRECLERLAGRADMLVCSQTPNAALEAEWAEHDIAKYVLAICGQEVGSKKESLAAAKKYPPNHTLMIGDAPGDYKAAAANHCLFFPINPGAEEASWRRLHDEGIRRFFDDTFAGAYQQQLLDEFGTFLPEHPPWRVDD